MKKVLPFVFFAVFGSIYGISQTQNIAIGDLNYNATGNGEIFYRGEQYNITWDYELAIPSTTSIYYSENSNGCFVENLSLRIEPQFYSGFPNQILSHIRQIPLHACQILFAAFLC